MRDFTEDVARIGKLQMEYAEACVRVEIAMKEVDEIRKQCDDVMKKIGRDTGRWSLIRCGNGYVKFIPFDMYSTGVKE